MKTRNGIALIALCLGPLAIGCEPPDPTGVTPDGSGGSPSDHRMLDGELVRIGAGVPDPQWFNLPVQGRVTYDLVGRNSGNSVTVAILPESEVGYFSAWKPYRGYAIHQEVHSAQGSADVPAGRYALGVRCERWVLDCEATVSLTLRY